MKISNEKLFNMVMGGSKPIVRVTKESTVPDLDACFDAGMIGRIEKVSIHGNGEDMCYEFQIREDKFREINEPFMIRNYYDDEKIPQLNYIEADWAPSNGLESVFVMPQAGEADPADFEVVDIDDENPFASEYLESDEKSYVKFLEKELMKYRQATRSDKDEADAWEDQREAMFDELQRVLDNHDWYYRYSESHAVWTKGRNEGQHIDNLVDRAFNISEEVGQEAQEMVRNSNPHLK